MNRAILNDDDNDNDDGDASCRTHLRQGPVRSHKSKPTPARKTSDTLRPHVIWTNESWRWTIKVDKQIS